jgi:hypothetical protein
MSKKETFTDTGGPAFPFEYHNQTSMYRASFHPGEPDLQPGAAEQYGGATLRDYFAIRSLSAAGYEIQTHTDRKAKLATWCYEMADAMIQARKK